MLREVFVETCHVAQKILLEETARVFRDFPCIERIKVIIPLARERQNYISEIDLDEFQRFLQVNFVQLREDTSLWRGFLADINQPLIRQFAARYIHVEPY